MRNKYHKYTHRKLKAFTLAEVLATLVIIGIIAALVIPSAMNITSAEEHRTAFKKSISAINQALSLTYTFDGLSAHDYETPEEITELLRNKMLKIKRPTPGIPFTNTDLCSGSNVWATADGILFCVKDNYYSARSDNPDSICNIYNTEPCSIDGAPNLYIDVNGERKPNKITTNASKPKDIYQVMIYSQKVVPWGEAGQKVFYAKESM